MTKVFLTCEVQNLNIVDGYPTCTKWEYMQPTFPLYELDPTQLASLMGATTLFLAICFAGRGLVRMLFKSGTND